jgi:hypothetical protein
LEDFRVLVPTICFCNLGHQVNDLTSRWVSFGRERDSEAFFFWWVGGWVAAGLNSTGQCIRGY